MPRRKPTSGQMSLMGEYYLLGLKYKPHVETYNGHSVAILRVPKNASEIDRKMSEEALHKMASEIKSTPPNYRRRGMKR